MNKEHKLNASYITQFIHDQADEYAECDNKSEFMKKFDETFMETLGTYLNNYINMI